MSKSEIFRIMGFCRYLPGNYCPKYFCKIRKTNVIEYLLANKFDKKWFHFKCHPGCSVKVFIIFFKKAPSENYFCSEAVTRGVLWKKVFLKISQNFLENTSARVSFIIKLLAWGLQLYYKRDSGTGAFLWILQNFKLYLFDRTPPNDWFCLLLEERTVPHKFISSTTWLNILR